MSNIAMETGLPDIVSVQKRVFPLLYSSVVSTQPTRQPIATVYGLKRKADPTVPDDGSGWTRYVFRMDRWSSAVETIKLKTDISLDAITDMRSLGISEELITDHLADQIATDINQDMLDKLNKISTIGAGVTIAAGDLYTQSRNLYAYIHVEAAKLETETGATGTYIVAGGAVYGMLLATGWVEKVEGTNYSIAKSGLIVVNDKYSNTDYFITGVKQQYGDFELSSLVFSPYDYDGLSGLSYQLVTTDPKSFNKVFGVMARYSMTAAPLNDNADSTGAKDIDWDNITVDMKSPLSVYQAVTIS